MKEIERFDCEIQLIHFIKKRVKEDYQHSQHSTHKRDEKSRELKDLMLLKLSEIQAEVEKDFIEQVKQGKLK